MTASSSAPPERKASQITSKDNGTIRQSELAESTRRRLEFLPPNLPSARVRVSSTSIVHVVRLCVAFVSA